MGSSTFAIVLTTICALTIVSCQDFGAEEDDSDCEIDDAGACFPRVDDVFRCSVSPLELEPSCATTRPISQANLERLCIQMQDSLNDCMPKLVGSCWAADVKHSFFQWQKPLNAMLEKLCSSENIRTLADSSDCFQEGVFICIYQYEQVDWIELITTKMPPDTCMSLELRVQHCMSEHVLPPHCLPFNTILMDLTQEFIDNTGCNNQPAILVPLDKDVSKSAAEGDKDTDDENERDCELSPFIIAECFQPMFRNWICYFNSESKCNFRLESLCSSANDSIYSCASNLIGYGCEEVHEHNFFKEWLSEFNVLYQEICPSEPQLLLITTEKYFKGKTKCWEQFFSCFSLLESDQKFINLITTRITGEICRHLGDKIDSCVAKVHSPNCDPVMDKIQNFKNKFTTSKACTAENSATGRLAQHSLFYLLTVVPLALNLFL